jgi:integrase
VSRVYEIKKFLNVDESRPKIDDSKLIISLHIDRSKYQTNEELYRAIRDWWVNTKDREPKTIESRIRYARSMAQHSIYPVDWFKFEPEQIINQLLYRRKFEYKEKGNLTGNPNYGLVQLHNLWKTVRTFFEAFGIDISYWGYSSPSLPEAQVKIIPRPETVNQLMRFHYTNNKFENALIKTILTIGFHAGLRPEELIILKTGNIHFKEGYIIIKEQKKKNRERQVWVDNQILNSYRQNSLKNWVNIWRPLKAMEKSGDFLFIQKDGKPFPSEDALRMYLAPFVKPVWPYFKPKIMRDWSAIARLIRTKIETKKWDIRVVKNDLGHNFESTTEGYIRFAENYYRNDPYDWLRAVLKFHKTSKHMLSLIKQEYGPGQKIPQKSINPKKGARLINFSPVEIYGPTGIRTPVSGSEGRQDVQTTSWALLV